MSVKYKVVKRKDMRKGAAEDARVYSGQAVSIGLVEFNRLCEIAADGSTLTPADLAASFKRIVSVIKNFLLMGMSCKLDDLGVFRICMGSTGHSTKEEWKEMAKWHPAHIRFLPDVKFSAILSEIRIEELPTAVTATAPASPDDEKEDGYL